MLSKKIAVSSALITGARLLTIGLDLILIAVLAQFLTPEDFGLVALANGVLLILRAISDQPVADVLIQRKTIEENDLRVAFTLSVVRGILMALFLLALAVPMARIYDDERLIPMMCVLATAPIFQGLMSPAMVRFTHAVDYLPLTLTQISARTVTFVVAVLVAFISKSYWALIISGIATPATATICSYFFSPWRPKFGYRGTKNILAFTGWVTCSRFITTLNSNVDRFFIGSILGKADLGRYTVGDNLSQAATFSFAGPLSNTLFAGFSRINNDSLRLRIAYLKGQEILAAGLLPLGFGLAALASPAVDVLLTPDWHETKWIIAILAPTIALQTMILGVQSISMALGKPRILAIREGISFALRVPLTIWAAWQFGLIGAALARSMAGIIIVYINLRIAQKILGISVLQQVAVCKRSILSVIVMSCLLWFFQAYVTTTWAPIYILLTGIFVGATGYISCHFLIWRILGCPKGAETQLISGIRHILQKRLRK
jgi:PST family polysaccharide transporter